MQKQTRHRKHRVQSRKKNQKRNKGGGCSCLFSGGNGAVVGPSPGFSQLSSQSYYPVNTFVNDPNYQVVDSRQTANFLSRGGGKTSRGSRKPKRVSKSRKIRGGSSSGTPVGNMIDNLKIASGLTVVGANEYGGSAPALPYTRYTIELPPRA